MSIEAIILAAGKGERLGRIKPLLMIDGRPALERIIETINAAWIDQIIVVLGYQATAIKRAVDLRHCCVVYNAEYTTGMAGSLRAGIAALSAEADGFLIMLADMPFVEPATISAVITTAIAEPGIVMPVYRNRPGFPIYINSHYIDDLLPTLKGDIGARKFIASRSGDVTFVQVNDPGAIMDIDCEEDIAAAHSTARGERR
ncbi:nucleotidyltransferase family protein [Candidatus Bipolaricaulota bacterium]|nr:nucleotidyltransferase family protein [Candidatus Bipolaricaulota bacterium]